MCITLPEVVNYRSLKFANSELGISLSSLPPLSSPPFLFSWYCIAWNGQLSLLHFANPNFSITLSSPLPLLQGPSGISLSSLPLSSPPFLFPWYCIAWNGQLLLLHFANPNFSITLSSPLPLLQGPACRLSLSPPLPSSFLGITLPEMVNSCSFILQTLTLVSLCHLPSLFFEDSPSHPLLLPCCYILPKIVNGP